jgi:WD40 repeat protein
VQSVAFSPDGTLIASPSLDGIVLWEVASGEEYLVLPTPTDTHDDYNVTFSPDGRIVAVGRMEGIVNLWDVATGTLLASLGGHEKLVLGVIFSPDGTLLASGSLDGGVQVWGVP